MASQPCIIANRQLIINQSWPISDPSRFLLVQLFPSSLAGHSQQNLLLLISFTERSNAIRIISAPLATRREREDYERNAF
ncbi:hypothetical protein FM036_24180 [Nostoc sp. HG1]|nr:hypothetical protein [Nostoc sp. HG1]